MDGYNVTTDPARGRTGLPGLGPRRPRLWRSRRTRRWMPFALCVLLPTLLGATYYFAIASDQYISEAEFIIRSPGHGGSGGGSSLATLLAGEGIGRSQDDAYAVNDYMLSRDALGELVRRADLRGVFARPEADGLARFPMLGLGNTSIESLFKYYKNRVTVLLDTTTGVTTLQVRAFRPDDAQRVANALLAAGEQLVNRLNERALTNTLADARREVTRAEEEVSGLEAQIATFRNAHALIDPTKTATSVSLGLAELDRQLAQAQTQITQLARTSPNSPVLVAARQRASAIEAQILTQEGRVAGSDRSLVPQIAAFDALLLRQKFAEKAYESASTSLETARVNAERQQLYLDRVVEPNLPDYSLYPRRFVFVGIIFASFLTIYMIGRLLVAGVREHQAH